MLYPCAMLLTALPQLNLKVRVDSMSLTKCSSILARTINVYGFGDCMCCCAGIAGIAIGRHVQCVNNITARLLPGNKRVECCCYTVVYENDLLANQSVINQAILGPLMDFGSYVLPCHPHLCDGIHLSGPDSSLP